MSYPPTEDELRYWRHHYDRQAVARMLDEIQRLKMKCRSIPELRQRILDLKKENKRLARSKTS